MTVIIAILAVGVMFCIVQNMIQKRDIEQIKHDNQASKQRESEMVARLGEILDDNSKALLKNAEVMERISDKIGEIGEQIQDIQEDVAQIKHRQQEKE